MPRSSKKKPLTWAQKVTSWFFATKDKLYAHTPHRSFQLTRRRDYVRTMTLPNPLLFILDVTQTLWGYRRIFLPLMAVYIVLYAVLVGAASQSTYSQLSDSITTAAEESSVDGTTNALENAGLTFLSFVSNGVVGAATETQQIFGSLVGIIAWLTTVWLLRNLLAGNKVKMRDGLYSAGAPIIATMIVMLIILVQLLPLALAAIGYAAAVSSGLIANGGVEAMLFWLAAGGLGLLSLYWITSSLFALVVVTLPGMYPLRALQTSHQLLLGRKVKFLLRIIWMLVFIAALWLIVLIPTILFDGWVKSVWVVIDWLPIVPIVALVLGAYTVFWASTYVYLLYRKVVDNE